MARLRSALFRGRGFTLIELLVVIAIIAILIGLLLPPSRRCVRLPHAPSVPTPQAARDCHARLPRRHRQSPYEPNAGGSSSTPTVGWPVQILPYIEQGNMLQLLAINTSVTPNVVTNPGELGGSRPSSVPPGAVRPGRPARSITPGRTTAASPRPTSPTTSPAPTATSRS